jgi:hypothetical protein
LTARCIYNLILAEGREVWLVPVGTMLDFPAFSFGIHRLERTDGGCESLRMGFTAATTSITAPRNPAFAQMHWRLLVSSSCDEQQASRRGHGGAVPYEGHCESGASSTAT